MSTLEEKINEKTGNKSKAKYSNNILIATLMTFIFLLSIAGLFTLLDVFIGHFSFQIWLITFPTSIMSLWVIISILSGIQAIIDK